MTRAPVHGTAKLYLQITLPGKPPTLYTVYNLEPDHDAANPAWRLTKLDGTFYDMHQDKTGVSCTCPDWVWCREHKDPKGCKHVAAFRSAGLLRKTT